MSLLNILSNISFTTKNKPPASVKTTTPLGMHQGSTVILPEVDIALAQVDGSIVKFPSGPQIVYAVGKYTLFGVSAYNVYFGNNTFIRLITVNNNVEEAYLFSSHAEVLPQSQEEWEFWLGRYKDSSGNVVRDENGNPIIQEYGLIGFPAFQIDGPPQLIYNRNWYKNLADSIMPVNYTEVILDNGGNTVTVNHEACEYVRKVKSDDPTSIDECLLATMTMKTGDNINETGESSVNIFVGIRLDIKSIKVLSV